MKGLSTLLAALIALGGFSAAALAAEDAVSHTSATANASANTGQESVGEVRKVDKDAGKITIKHGPLDNLGMPAMTMVFRVKDPAMLDQVKEGDKIHFVAEKVNGALTVVKLEPAN